MERRDSREAEVRTAGETLKLKLRVNQELTGASQRQKVELPCRCESDVAVSVEPSKVGVTSLRKDLEKNQFVL